MAGHRLAPSTLRRLAHDPPRLPACDVPAGGGSDLGFVARVDDRTADYVLEVREAFETMNDATTQLAALLILAAAGGRDQREHAVLEHVRRSLREACATLIAARATPRAEHHHGHMRGAGDALAQVLARADRLDVWKDKAEVGAALAILRQAGDQLRWAAGALPGFETIAFSQGCGCCTPKGLSREAS